MSAKLGVCTAQITIWKPKLKRARPLRPAGSGDVAAGAKLLATAIGEARPAELDRFSWLAASASWLFTRSAGSHFECFQLMNKSKAFGGATTQLVWWYRLYFQSKFGSGEISVSCPLKGP